ncbi:putative major facilitator, sugar transporter, major facilitator superfamily [Rosa chinensis]|uniref:Putative major facilitator, sugar transporter, major facilitator superfamily n=1 Tax=Rosa chinensis TaxID=74649 RepID=A0A2P6QWS9_ROSCH|nr:putative major facilitator, sugar transporter, major facilitator superfamily [Rosa chinensis]
MGAATGGIEFEAKITPLVIISCIMAATGGLMFGFDVGISALNLAMLIVGRLLLGCGVGFANQAIPLFLSEIAPTRIRGALNILFQLNITIGILVANLINYGTAKISLGLAGVPALLPTVGSLIVVDTPNSLIARGKLEEGKTILKRIRGVDNVEPEYLEIVRASRDVTEIFQQFTGINAIMFYAPDLFQTLGFKSDASLYSSSYVFVDKAGRRMLLIEAGVQMFLSQMGVAIVMGLKVRDHSNDLGHGLGILVLVFVCSFVASFGWSWGPLGWLIPSETFAVEARSAGQSVGTVWKKHWYWQRYMDYLQDGPGKDQV